MEGYLPKKNLIFFNPGKSGILLTHSAEHYITIEQLLKAQEFLVGNTSDSVIYIEDRRSNPRSQQGIGLNHTAL
ncbi:MAG: hypothetical protein K8S18_07260 [Desulfobacula sp.]|nr:hypothetical protein [Desulfobacula sp.]